MDKGKWQKFYENIYICMNCINWLQVCLIWMDFVNYITCVRCSEHTFKDHCTVNSGDYSILVWLDTPILYFKSMLLCLWKLQRMVVLPKLSCLQWLVVLPKYPFLPTKVNGSTKVPFLATKVGGYTQVPLPVYKPVYRLVVLYRYNFLPTKVGCSDPFLPTKFFLTILNEPLYTGKYQHSDRYTWTNNKIQIDVKIIYVPVIEFWYKGM